MRIVNIIICFFWGHDTYDQVCVEGTSACLRCHDFVEVAR